MNGRPMGPRIRLNPDDAGGVALATIPQAFTGCKPRRQANKRSNSVDG